VLPDLLSLNLPYDLSCASFSFCSRTSARRLRKSERFTSPIVCDLSRSSAEAVWVAKDRGEDVPGGVSDDGAMIGNAAVSNAMMTTSQRDQSSKYSEGLFRVSVHSRNGLGVDDAKPMRKETLCAGHPTPIVERLASTLPVDSHQSPHDILSVLPVPTASPASAPAATTKVSALIKASAAASEACL
jgi:hypothetical protein